MKKHEYDPMPFMDKIKYGVVTLAVVTILLQVIVWALWPLLPGFVLLGAIISLFMLVIGRRTYR